MALQKVNTEAIAAMAQAIATANDSINSSFETLRNQGGEMESSWKSKAGSLAVTMMHELFNGNEARSVVLENYVNYLNKMVNPGYIASEEQNTSLADQFL